MLGRILNCKPVLSWKATFVFFFFCLGIVLIADFGGDREYVVRLARSNTLEPFFLLIGAVFGFLLRDPSDEHAQDAFVFAILAVFLAFLLAPLSNLKSDSTWFLAAGLFSALLASLINTLAFILQALRAQIRAKRIQASKPPQFIRTKPPRYH
ncbi:hypothetical protein [Salinicola rhizosphaerae]|uniref:Uncharacterized protein n=1 Tax=Salinicola rhizosphaerae TaxID=1443141 RepID=A0ABQ3EFI2_9GAMM|nr:hypothetical protein [Salinicola rhizosphaerae]GHB32961.1 hypothetical protein GCM10009038_34890 [Salinicola rhizosphaerae]